MLKAANAAFFTAKRMWPRLGITVSEFGIKVKFK